MNSYQVHEMRKTDPEAAYKAVVKGGEGRYVWKSGEAYSPVKTEDYVTLDDLRHGCGDAYIASKRFATAAEAARESSLLPNCLADAYLRDLTRSHHGSGFRVH